VQPLATRVPAWQRTALRGIVEAELVPAVGHPHDVAHPGEAAIDLVAAQAAGGQADQPTGRRVEQHAPAASLTVAAEQAPFLGIELLAEQLGIAADLALQLRKRLGDVLQDRAFGPLGRDEPQHQRLIDIGERAIHGSLLIHKR
jgi:hypothetical protein